MKRIFILVYALIAGIITAVIFYLVLKAKFPAFFNSWYFKWHVAAFIKYTSVAILVAVIASLIDLLKHRGDGSKVFIIKNVLHFYKNIAALTGRELTYIFWMVTLTFFIVLIAIESGLRVAGIYTTESEREGRDFVSSYDASHERGWLHISSPFTKFHMQNGEFNEDYKANSQGLFDKEWPLQKKNKTVRIACIGDSFTQGIGTSADSSYPAQLAKSFQSDTEVMNFGVAGSDPVFGYMLLKQKALAYSPDIVTLTVNITDITDVMIRGGIERFRPDTTTHFRQPPWWEPVFAHCYLARVFAIDAYKADWNTHLTEAGILSKTGNSQQTIEAALDSANALCNKQGIRFIVIFHPTEDEVKQQKMQCEPIMFYCIKNQYEVLDVLQYFQSQGMNANNSGQYYWHQDAHNNAKGYALFAKALQGEINSVK